MPDESVKSVMWYCWQCLCMALYVLSFCKAGGRIIDDGRLTNRVEELSFELTGEFTLESQSHHHSSRRIRRQGVRYFSDLSHSVTTVIFGSSHNLTLVQWAGQPTPVSVEIA